MLKVVQINACDSTASTGTVMRDIQDVCIHSGIECHIAYSTTERSETDILNGYKIGTPLEFRIHQILSHLTRKQAYYSTFATKRFLRYLDKIRPDIVHLHNLHNHYININLLLKHLAKRDIATVITLHDNWFFTGECCLYENYKCTNWQSGCHNCPLDNIGINRYIPSPTAKVFQDRKLYLNNIPRLHLVGVSDWMTSEARKSFLKDRPITTIRNGVRTDVFRPLTKEGRLQVRHHYNIKDNEYVILGPASKWLQPSNRSGLQTILDNLQPDERLFLYGCAFPQLSTIHHHQLTLIPFTPHKPLLSTIYSMADIFINCTHTDTCSFINIESQACGTPVITFDNTGAAETVDNHCGFRVKTDDYEAISQLIRELRQTHQNTDATRQWVNNHFSMTDNYKSYIQIYNTITK